MYSKDNISLTAVCVALAEAVKLRQAGNKTMRLTNALLAMTDQDPTAMVRRLWSAQQRDLSYPLRRVTAHRTVQGRRGQKAALEAAIGPELLNVDPPVPSLNILTISITPRNRR